MDPSITYDTVSYEPVLNVYQTLINFNGTSVANYVPTVATCVPGTAQCVTDYGTSLTDGLTHWTFVIDKTASFYDPSRNVHWGVYPSDVVFSVARSMAFADLPGVGLQNGWIISQALEPFGSPSFDGGIHFPFNNTPQGELGGMLVNNSTYCPAAAMINDHGCVTFLSTGTGANWPNFLQFVADNLGASITPCGWFTFESAGIPGWPGTSHSRGDGPCTLPGGFTSTDGGWAAYLAGISPTSWDSFEELAFHRPAIQPGVQWAMVGSGPYYGGVSIGVGYSLVANPFYAQPEACGGNLAYAQYVGYCDPAPNHYQGNVSVVWETAIQGDGPGVSAYGTNSTDFASILTSHTTTMLTLAAHGNINVFKAGTISNFFLPFTMNFSASAFASCVTAAACSGSAGNIPSDFFTHEAARNFLINAYPYVTIENTAWTSNGIQFLFQAGGPIPVGMGNYYPNNVSFPSQNPDANIHDNGSAGWWFHEGTTPSSPFYDPQLASCLITTCTFQITGQDSDPGLDTAITDWIAEIESLSGNHVQPTTADMSFADLLNYPASATPGTNPLSVWNLGWAPDYPDPTDYVPVMAGPDNVYTFPDAVAEQLSLANTSANRTICGHDAGNFTDALYWAVNSHVAQLNDTCQGIAYDIANSWSSHAAGLPDGPRRVLEYNIVEHIYNKIGLMVWLGQANSIITAAKWILPSSVNTNIMIGGGGDQIWFQVKYVPFESTVKFNEVGLPNGQTFTVTAGSPGSLKSQTVAAGHTSISFQEPNGTLPFVVGAPSGYGLAKVTGAGHPTYTSANVTGVGTTTVVLHFGTPHLLFFNESILAAWPGLAGGTQWFVNLTSTPGGPPGMSGNTTGTSLNFTVFSGTLYHFTIGKPAIYKDSPGHGTVSMPAHVLVKAEKFKYNTAGVIFKRTGLPAGKMWGVNITGPIAKTLSGTAASLPATGLNGLVNGTYTVVAWNFTALHPHFGASHATFMIHVSVPSVTASDVINYTASPAAFAPALPVGTGSVNLGAHLILTAVPMYRETE